MRGLVITSLLSVGLLQLLPDKQAITTHSAKHAVLPSSVLLDQYVQLADQHVALQRQATSAAEASTNALAQELTTIDELLVRIDELKAMNQRLEEERFVLREALDKTKVVQQAPMRTTFATSQQGSCANGSCGQASGGRRGILRGR